MLSFLLVRSRADPVCCPRPSLFFLLAIIATACLLVLGCLRLDLMVFCFISPSFEVGVGRVGGYRERNSEIGRPTLDFWEFINARALGAGGVRQGRCRVGETGLGRWVWNERQVMNQWCDS